MFAPPATENGAAYLLAGRPAAGRPGRARATPPGGGNPPPAGRETAKRRFGGTADGLEPAGPNGPSAAPGRRGTVETMEALALAVFGALAVAAGIGAFNSMPSRSETDTGALVRGGLLATLGVGLMSLGICAVAWALFA